MPRIRPTPENAFDAALSAVPPGIPGTWSSTGVAVLTVKGGRGLARVEVERPITMDEADGLWPFTAGRRIDKVRHGLMVGTHRVDLDLYAGPLAGLSTAEVEFESEAEAAVFVAPPWFGVEVTGDGRWGNASLARKGAPDR